MKLWEKSAALDPSLAHGPPQPGHRLVAPAAGQRPRPGRSPSWKRPSRSLHRSPLAFRELDELYRAAGSPPEKRLAMLETHQDLVAQHAEALSREIALLVFAGRYDDAIRLMTGRRFEVWEGGKPHRRRRLEDGSSPQGPPASPGRPVLRGPGRLRGRRASSGQPALGRGTGRRLQIGDRLRDGPGLRGAGRSREGFEILASRDGRSGGHTRPEMGLLGLGHRPMLQGHGAAQAGPEQRGRDDLPRTHRTRAGPGSSNAYRSFRLGDCPAGPA